MAPTERIHSEVAQLRQCLELCTEIAKQLGPPPTSGMTILEFNRGMDKLRSDVTRAALITKYRQSPHYPYREDFNKWAAKLNELQEKESIFSVSLNLQEGKPVVVTFTLSDETGLPGLVVRSSLDKAHTEILSALRQHINTHRFYVNHVAGAVEQLWLQTP